MLGSVSVNGSSVIMQIFFRDRDSSSLSLIQLHTLVMVFRGYGNIIGIYMHPDDLEGLGTGLRGWLRWS